jgi:hypothetical protein
MPDKNDLKPQLYIHGIGHVPSEVGIETDDLSRFVLYGERGLLA